MEESGDFLETCSHQKAFSKLRVDSPKQLNGNFLVRKIQKSLSY